MTDTYQKPCTIWAEHLAASEKDLLEAERALLDEHVASCPACTATRYAYQQMDNDIAAMPPIEPHMIYAEQLSERKNMLNPSILVNGEQFAFPDSMMQPGRTQVRKAKRASLPVCVQDALPVSGRVSFQRLLTTVAAVLVVCSLIGSAILLFNSRIQPGVGGADRVPHGPLYVALSDGTVYALQQDTGTILWKQMLNLGGQSVIGGPAVAHGVVYVGSFNNSLYALRASDGTLLWQHTFSKSPTNPIAGDNPQVIYVSAGPTLYALDTSNGSELWHRTGNSTTFASYNIPVTISAGQIYGYDGSGLYALRASDGTVIWKGKNFSDVALVVAGGKVFATVGTGEQIEVLRASDGQDIHTLSVQGNIGYDQGKLYVANQESHELFVLNPADEKIIAQVQMACPVQDSPMPLVVRNGLVYTYSWGRSLAQSWVCAMHASDGKQVWRWTESQRKVDVRSMVAANNRLYFLYIDGDFASGTIYGLDSKNGAQSWKYTFPSNFPYGGYFAIEGE